MQRAWAVGVATVASVMLCSAWTHAQGSSGQKEIITSVHGRVLNGLTKQPVSRALVILHAPSMATFTDDRGQFEFKIVDKSNDVPNAGPFSRTFVQRAIEVRKPGFLQRRRWPTISYTVGSNDRKAVTIYLEPEALIVGHVEVPGSEGDVRITCQLFRRVINGGRESWSAQRTFKTWADGEFRFSELEGGTYKLITLEQQDRDPTSSAQMFAYTPLYYPNATDFSLASPIVVKAGETARVNLTVARRKYYPVKIAVANAPRGLHLDLMVYPVGHRSPGWSLGYIPGEGTIRGSLPDGNYTVEASAQGNEGMTGVLDFSVKGAPVEGPTLILVPDATVSVKVREEFQASQSNFATLQATQENSRPNRISNVHVTLSGIDELQPFQGGASSQLVEGSQEAELTIPNVRPGQYVVDVQSAMGYAASVQCGGKDVMHQPLVVGAGGSVPPIEVMLRDDGAQIDGMLEEEGDGGDADEARTVYLVPAGETGGGLREIGALQRKFTMQQIPPGDYVLMAFPEQQEDLLYGNEEATNELLSKGGKMIHLEAGQKLSVKVQVIGGDEE
jgi:hypothetical protein